MLIILCYIIIVAFKGIPTKGYMNYHILQVVKCAYWIGWCSSIGRAADL